MTERVQVGAYGVLAVADREGPEPLPGQLYMLAAARGWGAGAGERPHLPRACSVQRVRPGGELEFLLEDVGPGTHRLLELGAGDQLWLTGPLGRGFSAPPDGRRAVLVGGGVGLAPLVILADALLAHGIVATTLLGFRDRSCACAAEQLAEFRLATDDGSVGHHGPVTDLLAAELGAGQPSVVYACGPPAMLDAVRGVCARAAVPAQLALESGMACGFGACFGCVVPTRSGYLRLCVDGPVLAADDLHGPLDPHPGPPPGPAGGGDRPPAPGTPDRAPAALPAERAMVAGTPSAPAPPAPGAGRGKVAFCGLELAHPVINGSGTYDVPAAVRTFGETVRYSPPFAAFVSKTITLTPRQGNPPPRLWETAAGLINSIGLPNKGLYGYLCHDLPELARLPVPLITNVMGSTAEEFCELIDALEQRPEVAALELNVSCPNVETGLDIGADAVSLGKLLARLRPRTSKPLIVKLTPNTADVASTAEAAEAEGADAVSLINTLRAAAVDPDTGRAWLGAGSGGLSGPAIRSVALGQVARVAQRVAIPIVGMGGVTCGRDALGLLDAGATLVAVGTESFRDPLAGARIAAELSALCGETRRRERDEEVPGPGQRAKSPAKRGENHRPV